MVLVYEIEGVVFEPSDTATKNMIWDERRLIVWDVFHRGMCFIVGCVSSSLAVYNFMIRSGLYERIYEISERFGPFVVQSARECHCDFKCLRLQCRLWELPYACSLTL